jgi:excisionase family DNA binding protein
MGASWDDEYLTVKEIAQHLKLNQQTLRNWIDQGQLPAVRIGRRVRVRRADLDRILAQGRPRRPSPNRRPSRRPRLWSSSPRHTNGPADCLAIAPPRAARSSRRAFKT